MLTLNQLFLQLVDPPKVEIGFLKSLPEAGHRSVSLPPFWLPQLEPVLNGLARHAWVEGQTALCEVRFRNAPVMKVTFLDSSPGYDTKSTGLGRLNAGNDSNERTRVPPELPTRTAVVSYPPYGAGLPS